MSDRSMSTTSIDTAYYNPPEVTLTSSLDSLREPTQWSKKQISQDYDLAQGYFSSKQFREAYDILEALISPPKPKASDVEDEAFTDKTPIATAKSSLRVKVWVLYFKLLDALIGSGPNEGVAEFGRDKWRQITSRVSESTIWKQVLQDGYGGILANVEAEVVWDLGQLVFLYAIDQRENQRYLESYISSATQAGLNTSSSNRGLRLNRSIIHLLATDVLPSNGEWDYARTLISLSEIFTKDEREEMRQELEEAEQQRKQTNGVHQAKGLPAQATPIDPDQQQAANGGSTGDNNETEASALAIPPEAAHRQQDSDKDFGIEHANPSAILPPAIPKSSLKPPSKPAGPQPTKSPPIRSSKPPAASMSVYKRSAALISNLQRFMASLTRSASRNPIALLRFVLFLVGIVVALSRRDVKAKITQAWEKVQRTIGMGVKVSYI